MSDLGKLTLKGAKRAFDKTWDLHGHKVIDRVTKVEGTTVFLDRTVIPAPIKFLEINFTIKAAP